jgi:Uma2 family endonuclease
MSDTIAIATAPPSATKPKVTRLVSLATYLDKEAKSVEKHEFINGKIVRMPGAKARHNQIAAQFTSALIVSTDNLDSTFIVYNSDMKIYIPMYNHAVYPDAVVVCEAPEYWNGREDIILNPVLIVEVLSASTQDYDRHDKFMKYKTLASFKEYVLVRQDICRIETFYREQPNLWRETIESDFNASIYLASLDVHIDLKKIYKNISFQ